MHKLTAEEISTLDLSAFESKELSRLGMPKGIVMRHRPAHFQRNITNFVLSQSYLILFIHSFIQPSIHRDSITRMSVPSKLQCNSSLSTGLSDLFSASSYAAAYYVYLWAEVLDAGTLSFHPYTSVKNLCIYLAHSIFAF
jgi:Peptidase family M3